MFLIIIMNICFFVRHFTERGTEVAIYDYAKYNEEILHNHSYIVCFNEQAQQKMGLPSVRHSYEKFKSCFPILEIQDMQDMKDIIIKYNIDFFYTQTGGGYDFYQFENKELWGPCKTIKHCVFDTTCPESDFYISISHFLNRKFNTQVPVIPLIVTLPECDENLRDELNIPLDATVYGRYGGYDEFNVEMAQEAIQDFLVQNKEDNIYFLFMNTKPFFEHPRILYLEKNIDFFYKTKFVNTCDAMIHGRAMGETFGLSVAEFSLRNKPIITCPCGDMEHIQILREKAILYRSKEELHHLFKHIKLILQSRTDWNAYQIYNPENVMELFQRHIFSK